MHSPHHLLAIVGSLLVTSTFAAPAANTVPAVSYPYGDTLSGGQFLTVNQGLISQNGAYNMVLQSDGNLIISSIGNTWGASAVWASQTSGQSIDHASMQTDGNFVVYGTDDKARWSSSTWSTDYGSNGYKLILANDGSFSIFKTTTLTTYNQRYWD